MAAPCFTDRLSWYSRLGLCFVRGTGSKNPTKNGRRRAQKNRRYGSTSFQCRRSTFRGVCSHGCTLAAPRNEYILSILSGPHCCTSSLYLGLALQISRMTVCICNLVPEGHNAQFKCGLSPKQAHPADCQTSNVHRQIARGKANNFHRGA